MISNTLFNRYRTAILGIIVFFIIIFTTVYTTTHSEPRPLLSHDQHSDNDLVLPPPPIYQNSREQPSFCAQRFGLEYLRNLSMSAISYCESSASSKSSLTCFRTSIDKNGRVDSFCVGGPVAFDTASKRFTLDCQQKQHWDGDDTVPRLDQFPAYWYQTGPSYIFQKYVNFQSGDAGVRKSGGDGGGGGGDPNAQGRRYAILVKREASNYNLWHSLMEILSVHMSLDVLRMTTRRSAGSNNNEPFFSPENPNTTTTQVIILDDLLDGPFFDLWGLYASKPPLRLSQILSSDTHNLEVDDIIVPLPGGSNPFWQGDWDALPCEHSDLLRVFSQRVLDFYNIDTTTNNNNKPLTLTLIDRKEKRKLLHQTQYISHLRSNLPDLEINVVDFASIGFAEQLRIIRGTDVLVGVHGAGLTHGMFLRPGSAMVEILPPGFKHKGFRNLAKVAGVGYFSAHGIEVHHDGNDDGKKKGDWQQDDVLIEEDRFLDLLRVAVVSMYHSGGRDGDVN